MAESTVVTNNSENVNSKLQDTNSEEYWTERKRKAKEASLIKARDAKRAKTLENEKKMQVSKTPVEEKDINLTLNKKPPSDKMNNATTIPTSTSTSTSNTKNESTDSSYSKFDWFKNLGSNSLQTLFYLACTILPLFVPTLLSRLQPINPPIVSNDYPSSRMESVETPNPQNNEHISKLLERRAPLYPDSSNSIPSNRNFLGNDIFK